MISSSSANKTLKRRFTKDLTNQLWNFTDTQGVIT